MLSELKGRVDQQISRRGQSKRSSAVFPVPPKRRLIAHIVPEELLVRPPGMSQDTHTAQELFRVVWAHLAQRGRAWPRIGPAS